MEPEVEEIINKADVYMEAGQFNTAKNLYQSAYILTNDAVTKATLKEIIDNL